MEAGSVIANHYNERQDKNIFVFSHGKSYATGVEKFGALVGDHTKVGANAVLSPGTILQRNSVVGRLALVDQSANRP
jgi:acetyltransferase-like isoleucine patch superfamily enzyme